MKKIIGLCCLISIVIILTSCDSSAKIKKDIFAYIAKNSSSLSKSVSANNKKTEFHAFKSTGFSDAGIDYGYYYSKSDSPELYDKYQSMGDFTGFTKVDKGWQWHKPNSGEDWYYTERICNNWFYYELHFG